jgi:hypothetical protein
MQIFESRFAGQYYYGHPTSPYLIYLILDGFEACPLDTGNYPATSVSDGIVQDWQFMKNKTGQRKVVREKEVLYGVA